MVLATDHFLTLQGKVGKDEKDFPTLRKKNLQAATERRHGFPSFNGTEPNLWHRSWHRYQQGSSAWKRQDAPIHICCTGV